ncbi:MAG: bifunctional phosphoribosylaminoimidazolecarboxamide formyltransferase/IMP cyclohydrolase [Candidatus Cloacimonas sp. 4484_209]|nr:MAG: bifunctional phosphoribosylaminoimidazolecarboxamide formyltransferase/IMP cyclohydrolase [Candidatus Cloacimonas sp. 4484_209]
MKRALITVYDKKNIVNFAGKLAKNGYEIVSTGGTANLLQNNKIKVINVSSLTGFDQMLNGRVKTLHPKIFGGILARDEDKQELIKNQIGFFDIVICNLYPFEQVIQKNEVTIEEALENIDIGGVALLRAAAKNFPRVTVVSDINDYNWVADKIESGGSTIEERLFLAQKAFLYTSRYDSIIADFFIRQSQKENILPSRIIISLEKDKELRYGENAHQKAALYREILPASHTDFIQYQGKELSFNNIIDMESAFLIANSFTEPASAIIKHRNPCGVGIGNNLSEAFTRALSTDPMSAFGGIIGLNRAVNAELAGLIIKSFKEVVIAPEVENDALEVFKKKKNLRVIVRKTLNNTPLDFHKTFAGWLIQQTDDHKLYEEEWEFVSAKKPDEEQLAALRFAWKVAGFVKSNAIVITDSVKTIGIGAGQMSRIDAAELAVKKAKQAGLDVSGCVMASDGFFPFRDSIDFAAKEKISAVIEPGGSIRDKEVIDAACEKDIVLIFSHRRHFRH